LCHADYHHESKAANLIKLYKEMDEVTNEFFSNSPTASFCRKGCHCCCYDSFPISQIEFEVILNELKKYLNQKQIEELFDRALEQNEIVKKSDPVYYSLLETNGSRDQTAFFKQIDHASNKRKTAFPCLFLNQEEGMCTVYENRPYICRAFGTTHVENDILVDYDVCEVIPSSKALIDSTPAVDHIERDRDRISNLLIDGQHFTLRPYPIYYWFKIYYEKNGLKKQIPSFEQKMNFASPQAIADKSFVEKGWS
jgi:Fe-S-cluster containining protein